MNYYRILGVEEDADERAIKTAYRRLAKELHPDRNKHDPFAEDLIKRLNEAYQVLSDPKTRRQHDLVLKTGVKPETVKVAAQRSQVKDMAGLLSSRIEKYLHPGEFHWRKLPPSHYGLLATLALIVAFAPSETLAQVKLTWLLWVIHVVCSSYMVHRNGKVAERDQDRIIVVVLSHLIAALGSFAFFVIALLILWIGVDYVPYLLRR